MLLSVENMIARRRVGDEAAVDMLQEAGFTGIDFSFCNMFDWDEVVDAPNSRERAEALAAYARSKGVVYSQSHAPFDFRYWMDMSMEQREFYTIVKSMQFAAWMGIPMIVVHGMRVPEDQDSMEYNLKFYRALLPYAEKFGIKIAVENLLGRLPGTTKVTQLSFGNPEMFCAVQDKLDSPFICGCFDVGHANITTHNAPNFIRQSKGYIHYVHLHDNDGVDDLHQLPALQEGSYINYTMPWKEVLAALHEIDYSGPFNLELLKYMDSFTTELLPDALALAAKTGRAMIETMNSET